MSAPLVRLVSWNVHECIGRDERRDPERVARVLEELRGDVVALQEVHADPRGGLGDQPAYLAERTGLEPVLGPTLERRGGRFGNVLLAGTAPTGVRKHDLAVPGREPRGALDVRLALPGGSLRVVATHLGLRAAERRAQVDRLLAAIGETAFRDAAEPLALAGDFNEWFAWSGALRALRRRLGRPASPRTFPARFPVLALDRVFVRPASALVSVGAHRSRLARAASDHLPLVAELDPGAAGRDAA